MRRGLKFIHALTRSDAVLTRGFVESPQRETSRSPPFRQTGQTAAGLAGASQSADDFARHRLRSAPAMHHISADALAGNDGDCLLPSPADRNLPMPAT